MLKPNQETFSPTNMSTQVIKKTSESVAPKATKAQIIEALAIQEWEERKAYNENLKLKHEQIDKEVMEIAISHITNKSKEELPSCEFWSHYLSKSTVQVTIKDKSIQDLLKQKSKLGWSKCVSIDEIKKEIRVLVNNQTNIKENPLLKKENTDKVKLLLSFLKNPNQQTIELK